MAKKAAVDVLFVKSKVREYIKSKECNTSGDVKANGRKTVQEKDL